MIVADANDVPLFAGCRRETHSGISGGQGSSRGDRLVVGSSRVVVVGCGHMGLAIVQGLLGGGSRRRVVVVETSAERRETLSANNEFTLTAHLAVEDHDLVVLAIPPQDFPTFAAAERAQFSRETAVVSVMAGLTSRYIADSLGTAQVVRAIPNTPSEVFEGMSVYYAGGDVGDSVVAQADELLRSIGAVLRVQTEELVDDATAICGGGPAFVSYIVDAFCQFAESRGFTATAGRDMAVQVFSGTAALIAKSGKPPMQLCREVMTPNGTTERGIAAFDAAGLKASLLAALAASAQRSRELAAIRGMA